MEFAIDTLIEDETVLLLCGSKALKKTNLDLVMELTGHGYWVVILSVTLPYSVLVKAYQNRNIDLSQVYVIDTVTRYSKGSVSDSGDFASFISNPGNLTDMGVEISSALNKVSDREICLVIDDISTMLLYSSSATVSRFIHFIANKLRLQEARGVFVAVENGLDPALKTQLSTFTDSVHILE